MLLTAVVSILSGGIAAAQQVPRNYFSEPALAPDRPEMAFVAGGDIWRVAATGGEASLLVSHPADDSRPLYSPDGTRIAFVSTRTGGGDIYVLTLSTGELRRLTFEDAIEQLDAWSRDSEWIYYHSSSQDLSSMNDVFRIRASGGTPMPVAADRYASEFFAAPSPDGKTIAINARGIASRQWWRKGHSHLDISEIWLVRPGTPPSYERITDGGAKEIWPMWTPDGKSLFFVSDRTGVENIWRQPLAGTSRQISAFKDGRVLWPSISHDGKWIVFERDFGIWRMETVNGRAVPVAITLRGASAGPAVSHLSQTSGFDEIALSGDGRKMAFTVRGEIFAASAKDGGDAQRVTRTHAQEAQAAWSPDSRKLAYVSDRGGVHHIFIHDFGAQAETQLTFSDESDASPRFSPDGKTIAFLRGGRSVWLYDLEKKQERQLATGEVGRQPLVSHKALTWSPDSRWIAFTSRGNKGFSSVLAAPVSGGASQPVSFLANTLTRSILWSADGKYLLFDTSQRTEPTQVARVDLILRTPIFREDRFRDLFKPSAVIEEPAAAKPGEPKAPPAPAAVSIVFEQIRRRLSLLPIGLDVDDLALSMDGKTLLLTASAARQENLYTFSLDELAAEPPVARQITSSTGNKSHAQFAPDGKEVYYLERGRVQIANVDTRQSRTLNLTAEMDVDFHQEKRTVFRQAWSYQRDHFFDDRFNGVRWDALRMQYEPLAMSARTPSELYRIVNLMLGELNASHMGISGPQTQQPVTGQLGLRFDPAALENGQFRVAEVIPLGPAALAGIQTGEYVVAIDNVPLAHQTSVQELLQHKVSKRVELSVAPAAGAKVRSVVVLPVTSGVEKNLLYRAWVEDRRELVSRMSGGRLGYVHMSDMSSDSLSRLYIDLDSENHAREGVVIDIRNNTGGFVNAYALDVFARRPYLTFVERGRAAAPARSVLGQRALELPTILVINQHSLSDAEDFTEGYRRLKLGKVIGEPTAGWIIYTWNQRLIDGSSLRMPRVKVFDNDGQLMELHPRPVDVPIERPVGESYTGKDIQLDTAVRELLQQIEAARRPPTNGEAVR